jgi:hypothetical protein
LSGQRHRMTAALAASGAGDDGDRVVEFTHDGKLPGERHSRTARFCEHDLRRAGTAIGMGPTTVFMRVDSR